MNLRSGKSIESKYMKDKNKYLELIQNEYMKLFKYYLRSVFQVFIKTIIRDGKARFLVL